MTSPVVVAISAPFLGTMGSLEQAQVRVSRARRAGVEGWLEVLVLFPHGPPSEARSSAWQNHLLPCRPLSLHAQSYSHSHTPAHAKPRHLSPRLPPAWGFNNPNSSEAWMMLQLSSTAIVTHLTLSGRQ